METNQTTTHRQPKDTSKIARLLHIIIKTLCIISIITLLWFIICDLFEIYGSQSNPLAIVIYPIILIINILPIPLLALVSLIFNFYILFSKKSTTPDTKRLIKFNLLHATCTSLIAFFIYSYLGVNVYWYENSLLDFTVLMDRYPLHNSFSITASIILIISGLIFSLPLKFLLPSPKHSSSDNPKSS